MLQKWPPISLRWRPPRYAGFEQTNDKYDDASSMLTIEEVKDKI